VTEANPDLVILGARLPGIPTEPIDVVITAGRIDSIGLDAGRDASRQATRVIEADGSVLLPGFQDAHVHPPFAGRNLLHVFLNDLAGRDAYLAAIAKYAADHPDEPWVLGGGWSMDAFPKGLPRKEDLDAIVPDRPVFLFNRDVHGAWVNSEALRRAGISRDTPDPVDGRIERDTVTGEPTGVLHEGAAYSFNDTVVPLPESWQWEQAILASQRHLHSLGITTWQDAWVTPATQQAYESLDARGELTAHVVGCLWWDRHRGLEQIDELVERRGDRSGRTGRFRPTSIKIMTDGVLENYTGALLQPYCDGCGGHSDNVGLSYLDQEVLVEAVCRLDALDFQVHLHTIGDAAVRNGLDAFEQARRRNGANDNRHHMAHIQVVDPVDVARFAELGVVANCQALWACRDDQMDELTAPFLGPERMQRMYPFADLVASGARLAMGSDWSVSTADPLAQIEVAVTRRVPSQPHAEPLLPDQAISLEAALAAFTEGSAYVNHRDHETGRLEAGFAADVILLNGDPLTVPSHEIGSLEVTHTVAAGRVVHQPQAPSV